jgi:hypothetical protein
VAQDPHDIDIGEVYRQLLTHGTPTAEEALAINGNSWTDLTCHECFEEIEVGVQLGDASTTSRRPRTIYENCLKATLAMILVELLQVRLSSQVT